MDDAQRAQGSRANTKNGVATRAEPTAVSRCVSAPAKIPTSSRNVIDKRDR